MHNGKGRLVRSLLVSALALLPCVGAHATERDQSPAEGWTGPYVGGQLNYSWGNSAWRVDGPGGSDEGIFGFYRPYDAFKGTGSYFVGLQAGYIYRLASGVIIGFEADLLAPNTLVAVRGSSGHLGDRTVVGHGPG